MENTGKRWKKLESPPLLGAPLLNNRQCVKWKRIPLSSPPTKSSLLPAGPKRQGGKCIGVQTLLLVQGICRMCTSLPHLLTDTYCLSSSQRGGPRKRKTLPELVTFDVFGGHNTRTGVRRDSSSSSYPINSLAPSRSDCNTKKGPPTTTCLFQRTPAGYRRAFSSYPSRALFLCPYYPHSGPLPLGSVC